MLNRLTNKINFTFIMFFAFKAKNIMKVKLILLVSLFMNSNCEKYGFFEITEHKESEHNRLSFISESVHELKL